MKELIFLVEDDPSGGYTARALGLSIFTEADTKEELTANIREVVELYFDKPDEMPKIVRLHYVHDEVIAAVKVPAMFPAAISSSGRLRLGYQLSRQKGSHAIVTTQVRGEHHVAVPMHDPIKIGTLNNILRDVSVHHGITCDELLEHLQLT